MSKKCLTITVVLPDRGVVEVKPRGVHFWRALKFFLMCTPPKKLVLRKKLSLKSILIYLKADHYNHTIIKSSSKRAKTLKKMKTREKNIVK